MRYSATCCIPSVGLICHWKIRSTCLYLLVGIQTCKLDQLWWLSMSFNFVGALQKVSVIIHQHEQILISCFHQNIQLIWYFIICVLQTSVIAYQLFVLVIVIDHKSKSVRKLLESKAWLLFWLKFYVLISLARVIQRKRLRDVWRAEPSLL